MNDGPAPYISNPTLTLTSHQTTNYQLTARKAMACLLYTANIERKGQACTVKFLKTYHGRRDQLHLHQHECALIITICMLEGFSNSTNTLIYEIMTDAGDRYL
jgi:hypothetical protein